MFISSNDYIDFRGTQTMKEVVQYLEMTQDYTI